MTSVAMLGAAGRMGQSLVRCLADFADLELCAAVESEGHACIGKDAGLVAATDPRGIPVTADADAAIAAADVAIDFTYHSIVPLNARAAAEAGTAMVIGTTGLDEEETAAVRAAAARVPIVWAPNMSLGVNLLFALARQTAQILGLGYDVEIVETHHRHKQDAPSGTALRLGERIAAGRGQALKRVAVYGRNGLTGERPQGQIAFHAVRAGDAIGDHTVLFAADGERVELSHRATSRNAFAMGALRAAQWVLGRAPGLYDMQDVLGL